jgi:subtilisin
MAWQLRGRRAGWPGVAGRRPSAVALLTLAIVSGAVTPVAAESSTPMIVLLREDHPTARTAPGLARSLGFSIDRAYGHVVEGFSAHLTPAQVRRLAAHPAVAAVIVDEPVSLAAQTTPTGVSRIGATSSSAARINGLDDLRVDADVAIVDTGLALHSDLNVVGGVNCSTTDAGKWQDVHGHGTHVGGTVGAIDNGSGVVGVAPGVRLWAVKILGDDGEGLLSWYVCGLDWIGAQRDPADASRPRFEVANMSVAKWGADDGNCGASSADILHAAICRLVDGGVTIAVAAGNDRGSAHRRVPAAYDEVITVSALADMDGKPGGLGDKLCYSWGGYDKDDTFADFSNYGPDIDLIAPGKCIWSTVGVSTYGYLSGTSMAAPHVTGAIALYKASRPRATPAEVKRALQHLGNYGWNTATDPDKKPDLLVDASRIGALGTFSLSAPESVAVNPGASTSATVTVVRSQTFIEEVRLEVVSAPDGVSAILGSPSLFGAASTSKLTITTPPGELPANAEIRVRGRTWDASHEISISLTPGGASEPAAATGSTWVPITPVRLLDTRTGNGLSGAQVNGQPRTLAVAGRGGVPAGAIAVTGNVTVTGQTSGGYLAIRDTIVGTPTTSTLNLPLGDTRANGTIVSLTAEGTVTIAWVGASGSTAHVIFDVTGYFVSGASGATFIPLEPARVLDTRTGAGLSGAFTTGTVRTFTVAGRGGVPAGALAVTANLTVTGQTSSGYVSVGPTMTSSPSISTINFPVGDNRANGLTVPLSGTGQLSAVFRGASGSTTHLILDVTGYFVAGSAGAVYVPLHPERLLDTRGSSPFASSQPRSFSVRGLGGVPADALAVAGNVTITGQTSGGYVSIGPVMTASPTTSTVNFPTGDTRANNLVVRLAPDGSLGGVFKGLSGSTTHVIFDVWGYFR